MDTEGTEEEEEDEEVAQSSAGGPKGSESMEGEEVRGGSVAAAGREVEEEGGRRMAVVGMGEEMEMEESEGMGERWVEAVEETRTTSDVAEEETSIADDRRGLDRGWPGRGGRSEEVREGTTDCTQIRDRRTLWIGVRSREQGYLSV